MILSEELTVCPLVNGIRQGAQHPTRHTARTGPDIGKILVSCISEHFH